jgi:thioredoxin reductase
VSGPDLDVVIVGGGPAGMAAAVELRRRRVARVLVLEREPELGGIPRDCHHPGFGWEDLRRMMSGPGYARRCAARVRAEGAEVWTESSATRWKGERTLQVTTPRGVFDVSARAALLATGCRERPRAARLVPGDRPAGVLTTGALQRLGHGGRQPAGRRAVVVGAEHVSFSAVHTLTASGTEVAAMITDLPRHQTYGPLAWLAAGRHGIPLLVDSRITRIAGRGRVQSVEVTHRPSGKMQSIPCDTVVFTGDWIPDHELARAGGLAMDPGTRGPQVDPLFRTSSAGVFAAGNLLHGAETAGIVALEGRSAAEGIVRFLNGAQWRGGGVVPVRAARPILWVSPNALVPPQALPAARFVMRVGEFLRDETVEVQQGGRVLHRERFGRLVPNRSLRLSGQWVGEVAPDAGPVRVSVAGRPREEEVR